MLFPTSRSKKHPVGLGIPTFTPAGIAQALGSEKPKPEPVVAKPERVTTSLTIDLGTAARGALEIAKFLSARAEKKRAAERDLESRALVLAREYQGILGPPDLVLRVGCRKVEAEQCLAELEQAQVCRYLTHYQDEAVYVFPGFLPRIWECEYCSHQVAPTPGAASFKLCQCCGAPMVNKVLL